MSGLIDFLLSNPLTMVLLGIVVICVFLFIRECWRNIKDPQ
jgi:hypothetical protein